MGALVAVLGCTIKWTKTALKIWHPKHGHLKVGLRNRCPEIAALDALQLIKELEEKQLEEFNSHLHEMELRLEALQCDESKSWTEHLLTFRKDGSPASMWKALRTCPFTKDLPVDVLEMMVEGFDPSKGWEYLKGLPLSRKQRKRFMSSNSRVVHLYSGEVDNTSYFKESLKGDRVLLEIDITKSKAWNLNQKASVYQALLWAACQGKIDSVLGGPPCRTWSILRSRPAEGFPPPGRAADQLYGLTDLDPKERLKVDQDTALVAKQMWHWTLASLSRSVLLSGASCAIALCRDLVGFLLGHPEDPQRYRKQTPEVQSCPSLWRTIMWKECRDTFSLDGTHYSKADYTWDESVRAHGSSRFACRPCGVQGFRGCPITHVGPMRTAT